MMTTTMTTTTKWMMNVLASWMNLPAATPVRIIAIDGNIGVGKSTLMDQLEEQYRDCDDVVILREPVHRWTDVAGENLLQLFYTDPSKYAFLFQLYIFRTTLDELQRILANPNVRIVFCERSLESSRHVFAQMLRDAGHMTAMEFAIYESMFTNEVTTRCYATEHVYLDASVDVCHARIQQRARDGEEAISMDYLSRCATYYTTWFTSKRVSHRNTTRVICTNALSMDQVLEQFQQIVS